jgi:hypothetical protein
MLLNEMVVVKNDLTFEEDFVRCHGNNDVSGDSDNWLYSNCGTRPNN